MFQDVLSVVGLHAVSFLATRVLAPWVQNQFKDSIETSHQGLTAEEPPETQLLRRFVAQAFKSFAEILGVHLKELGYSNSEIHNVYEEPLRKLLKDAEVQKTLLQAFKSSSSSIDTTLLVERWQVLNLPNLPEEFDWFHIGTQYSKTIAKLVFDSPDLRELLGVYNQPESVATLHILREPHRVQCFTEPAIQLDLMLIPGGTFTMGSPEDELGRYDDEGPQHDVTVPPFLMGRYPITQAQWRTIATRTDLKVKIDLDPDPSQFKGEDRPLEQVSWHEAVEFCQRLSRLTRHTYRLPTEAEWEYACRAGTDTPFHFGETITTDLANYCGEDDEDDPEEYPGNYGNGPKGVYRQETTLVNHFHPLANAFGLCDLHGNVWEWCLDHWHSNYEGAPIDGSAWLTEDEKSSRVVRGGSWYVYPGFCRSACRFNRYPGGRVGSIGFRVMCEAQDS